MSYPDIDSSE